MRRIWPGEFNAVVSGQTLTPHVLRLLFSNRQRSITRNRSARPKYGQLLDFVIGFKSFF